MKTFLVPVDFTDNSLRALEYANGLAEKAKARIVVCHVQPKGSILSGLTGSQGGEKGDVQQKMDAFVAKASGGSVMPETSVRAGDTVDELVAAIEEFGVSLVVMGTGGVKGLAKRIFGTTAEAVAKKGLCPVLVIPEQAAIRPIEHIVYAADFENGDQVTALQLLQLKELFNATLTFLHIKSDKQPDYVDDDYIKNGLREQFPQAEINFVEIRNEDIVEGITNYVRANEPSLLSFTILHRAFHERVTHSSVSTKLLHNLQLPMLALPENGTLLDLQRQNNAAFNKR